MYRTAVVCSHIVVVMVSFTVVEDWSVRVTDGVAAPAVRVYCGEERAE